MTNEEAICPKCLLTQSEVNDTHAGWWDSKDFAECPECDPDGKSGR